MYLWQQQPKMRRQLPISSNPQMRIRLFILYLVQFCFLHFCISMFSFYISTFSILYVCVLYFVFLPPNYESLHAAARLHIILFILYFYAMYICISVLCILYFFPPIMSLCTQLHGCTSASSSPHCGCLSNHLPHFYSLK